MQRFYKISHSKLYAFAAMLLYAVAIAVGAEYYLPIQTYAPGIFRGYHFNGLEYFAIFLAASLSAAMIPTDFDQPSDWFLTIFIVLLLAPGLTLGIGSDNVDIKQKIVVLPALVGCMVILAGAKKLKIGRARASERGSVKKTGLLFALLFWTILFFLLLLKFGSDMRFSNLDEIYFQRALTSNVGTLWGYAQLYFSVVFSTLLIAYGLSLRRWRYFFLGSAGYVMMYFITAEKSQLLFPLFFLAVDYTVRKRISPVKFVTISLSLLACIIFLVVLFSDSVALFDFIGFYLFTRLLATPSQFILDYYDFFSKNGYTFFSQIRGFDLFISPPDIYASHPKWPQLGWIVGSDVHEIESNSNATFLASDGAASLGAIGMTLMAGILCAYLIIADNLSQKFPKIFWTVVFSQQAFILVSGSFFSLLLSFGGLFFLAFLYFFKPTAKPSEV